MEVSEAVNTSVPASSGLQDKTWCLIGFLYFPLNLKCDNQAKGHSSVRKIFYVVLYFFSYQTRDLDFIHFPLQKYLPKHVSNMSAKTIGPRFTSQIVVLCIYVKLSKFHE